MIWTDQLRENILIQGSQGDSTQFTSLRDILVEQPVDWFVKRLHGRGLNPWYLALRAWALQQLVKCNLVCLAILHTALNPVRMDAYLINLEVCPLSVTTCRPLVLPLFHHYFWLEEIPLLFLYLFEWLNVTFSSIFKWHNYTFRKRFRPELGWTWATMLFEIWSSWTEWSSNLHTYIEKQTTFLEGWLIPARFVDCLKSAHANAKDTKVISFFTPAVSHILIFWLPDRSRHCHLPVQEWSPWPHQPEHGWGDGQVQHGPQLRVCRGHRDLEHHPDRL